MEEGTCSPETNFVSLFLQNKDIKIKTVILISISIHCQLANFIVHQNIGSLAYVSVQKYHTELQKYDKSK